MERLFQEMQVAQRCWVELRGRLTQAERQLQPPHDTPLPIA